MQGRLTVKATGSDTRLKTRRALCL